MADYESVSIQFSALNVHQTGELNPEAPEYIPLLLQHASSSISSSSTFFCYQYTPSSLIPYTLFPPPPPPPSFYFRPVFHLAPQPPLPFPPPQLSNQQYLVHDHQQQSSDAIGQSQVPELDRVHASGDRARRSVGRWRGGRRRGTGLWRVKTSSTRSQGRRNSNRMTSTENEDHKKEGEGSSSWRMVMYRAYKRTGMKFDVNPVTDKSTGKTTVMIRNIPSRYTRKMMLSFLDRHCMEVNRKLNEEDGGLLSAYDFFYMPMDFKTGLNKSYAFVNFTTPEAVWRFYTSCNSQKWELFQSGKVREIAFANLQGTTELVDHFERTAFACHTDEFLPVYFQPPRNGCADVDRVTSTIGKRVS